MGFFDRARAFLGMDRLGRRPRADGIGEDKPPSKSDSKALRRPRKKEGRPALPEVAPSPGMTLEDVLALREAGRLDEARALLATLDKGRGLRAVLRAAAALDVGDEQELAQLLPSLAEQEPSWQLALQVAAAVDDGARRRSLAAEAERLGAPPWGSAWLGALSNDQEEQRRGIVDLLFEDAALARTVAARDLGVAGAMTDNDAIARYASFAHGRDLIRRFGAERVAQLLDRLQEATRRAPKASGPTESRAPKGRR